MLALPAFGGLAGELVWEAIGLRAGPLSCWEIREAAPYLGGESYLTFVGRRLPSDRDHHHHHHHHHRQSHEARQVLIGFRSAGFRV